MIRNFEPGMILLFKEKHGTRYFDASTEELAGKACLKILEERLKEDYECFGEEKPEMPKLTKEQVDAFPESWAKTAGVKELEEYKYRLKEYNKYISFLSDVKKAIKTNDYKLAIELIWSRKEWEYEGVDVDCLEEI